MSPPNEQGERQGLKHASRRFTPLTAIVVAMVVFVLGAWVGATFITSPGEAALNAGPPPPSVILAAVEQRLVEQRVVTRGETEAEVTVSALPVSTPAGAQVAVLSKPLPSLGTTFEAGDVVAEVSGRPVIVLPGAVPMYRELAPGASGDDVRQLQAALQAAGLEVGDERGVFGDATLTAVRELYAAAGHQPPEGAVPLGELLFAGTTPVRVVSARGALGTKVEDAELVLASGEIRVLASLTAAQLDMLREGDLVELSVAGDEAVVHGTVGALDDVAPAGVGEDGQRFASIVHEQAIPGAWLGQGLRVEVITSTSGSSTLAVPVGAVFLTADGSHEVVTVRGDGAHPVELDYTHVPVSVGVMGGGWASVEAAGGGLAAGDKVLLSSPPGP